MITISTILFLNSKIVFGTTLNSIKIHSLFFNDQRPVFNLRIDSTDIFAYNADKKKLNGREEEQAYNQGSYSHIEILPVNKLVDEITYRHQEADYSHAEADKTRKPQGYFAVIDKAQHGHIVKGVKVILGLSAVSFRLDIRDFRAVETELRYKPPEVRIGFVQIPEDLYKFPVVKAEPSKIAYMFGFRKLFDQGIVHFPYGEYQRVFPALLLYPYDNAKALFPFFNKIGYHRRGVLEVADKRYDRVAPRLEHAMERGPDVTEIADIDDNFYIFIGAGNFFQDYDRIIRRTVIDKYMLVAVLRKFIEDRLHQLVHFLDIVLFIVAGRKDAYKFFHTIFLPLQGPHTRNPSIIF